MCSARMGFSAHGFGAGTTSVGEEDDEEHDEGSPLLISSDVPDMQCFARHTRATMFEPWHFDPAIVAFCPLTLSLHLSVRFSIVINYSYNQTPNDITDWSALALLAYRRLSAHVNAFAMSSSCCTCSMVFQLNVDRCCACGSTR